MAITLAAIVLLAPPASYFLYFGPLRKNADILNRIDRVETAYLSISGNEIATLNKALMNLSVPDTETVSLFESSILTNELAPMSSVKLTSTIPDLHTSARDWPVTEPAPLDTRGEFQLWRPFLDQVDYFENAKLYIEFGDFIDQQETLYHSKGGFSGLAKMKDGRFVHATAKLTMDWKTDPSVKKDDRSRFTISTWVTESFSLQERDDMMFEEVLDRSIPEREDLIRARTSRHEEIVTALFQGTIKSTPPYFHNVAADRHPGVAVVDLDRDGFDDFYVMERHQTNMFFRNNGDETFDEIATDIGLDIEDHTAAAIFADFDNDGDYDAFLGRTLKPSRYLVNENGRFHDRSDSFVNGPLPLLVSSVSAVDYDQDGLLDIYISTYAAVMTRKEVQLMDYSRKFRESGQILADFLPEKDARRLFNLLFSDEAHLVRALPGPPNVLLKNAGDGRFEAVDDIGPLKGWRHTYQSTWGDYDGDGDQDVYLSNDFSVNAMIRNDGKGTFTDVTAETGTEDVGFGMGASWGDYDFDGRQDLYVTNMFSKAGIRVTRLAGDKIGGRFAAMAAGNTLFRNTPGRFEKVSGLTPPKLTVAKAGWGWGGQFVDFDNDTDLDIYALSGFYTAPQAIAIAEDT